MVSKRLIGCYSSGLWASGSESDEDIVNKLVEQVRGKSRRRYLRFLSVLLAALAFEILVVSLSVRLMSPWIGIANASSSTNGRLMVNGRWWSAGRADSFAIRRVWLLGPHGDGLEARWDQYGTMKLDHSLVMRPHVDRIVREFETSTMRSYWYEARGWPFASFETMYQLDDTTSLNVKVEAVSRGAVWGKYDQFTPRIFPFGVRWMGLLGNCALWVSVFMIVPLGWRTLRQWLRVRSGRCGRCGYSLLGLAGARCPECGE